MWCVIDSLQFKYVHGYTDKNKVKHAGIIDSQPYYGGKSIRIPCTPKIDKDDNKLQNRMYKVDDDETFLQCLANNKDDTLTITPSLCLIAKDYFYVKNMYSGVYDDKIISALNKYIKKCKIGTEFEVVRRQDNKSLYDVNYMGSRKCYDVTSTLTHDNNRSFAVIYPDGNLILFCGAQTCRNFRTTIDYGVDPSNIDNQLINEKMLQQAEQLEINNKKYANQSAIIISNFISNL